MTNGKGQGQRGWWGEKGVGVGGTPTQEGGRGRRDRGGERGGGRCRDGGRARGRGDAETEEGTRARAGQIPDMKQAERRPETAGCREKGKRDAEGGGEIGSEDRGGGVGGTETGGEGGDREREEGRGVGAQRRRHGHR